MFFHPPVSYWPGILIFSRLDMSFPRFSQHFRDTHFDLSTRKHFLGTTDDASGAEKKKIFQGQNASLCIISWVTYSFKRIFKNGQYFWIWIDTWLIRYSRNRKIKKKSLFINAHASTKKRPFLVMGCVLSKHSPQFLS